jgi:hypothetical protein
MWISAAVAIVIALMTLAVQRTIVFPRQPFDGPLPPLSDAMRAMALRLETDVRGVASVPHNIAHPAALAKAAAHIETALRSAGHEPIFQRFVVDGCEVCNIEAVIPARSGSKPNAGTLVIGAHYDAPDDSPGANDNGTGVAALLELARSLATTRPDRRLRLVFFVNEEQPYGKTADMGSYRHAKALKESREPVLGMIALETIGHFSDRPGSQRFPFPFGLLFPDRGNFVAFVGMTRARRFVFDVVAAFRAVAHFPSIGGVAPGCIEGIDLSDHWAYDHFGFPALMVTDTAPFRNPFYHSPADTPDTVDYVNLARVTHGVDAMIRRLCGPD